MRILVVEDDARIADFLLRALKPEGHLPVCVADGREALELVAEGDFELILFADFGPDVDIGTDLSLLEGHITGIRLPLNLCPDELMF